MGLFKRLFPGAAKPAPTAKPVAIPVNPHFKKSVAIPKGQSPAVGGKSLSLPGTGRPVATPVGGKPVAIREAMTLGRAVPPNGRRTEENVAYTGVEMLLAGTHTYLTSSWLAAAEYHRDAEDLEVWFLDGAHVTVHDISEAEARDFFTAPSKGGAYWDIVLGPNYVHGKPHTARKRWT